MRQYVYASFVHAHPDLATSIANGGWGNATTLATKKGTDDFKSYLWSAGLAAYNICKYNGVCPQTCPANTYCGVVPEVVNDTISYYVASGDCPDGGLSEAGSFYIQECFIAAGAFSDDTGQGEYTDKCYYDNGVI